MSTDSNTSIFYKRSEKIGLVLLNWYFFDVFRVLRPSITPGKSFALGKFGSKTI